MKLADSVLARIVQIVQEAMLTGTDAADHMRAIELKFDATNSNVLVLTDEYKERVEANLAHMVKFAEEQTTKKIVVDVGDADPNEVAQMICNQTTKNWGYVQLPLIVVLPIALGCIVYVLIKGARVKSS